MNTRILLFLLTLLAAAGLVTACGNGDGDSPEGEDFDGGTVVVDVQRDSENDQSRKLIAIADGQKGVEKTAEACVEEFLVDENLTQCWVFENQENYDNANVNEEDGSMTRNCWDAYAVFINGDLQTSKQTEAVRAALNCDRPVEGTTFTPEDDVEADSAGEDADAGDGDDGGEDADGDDG